MYLTVGQHRISEGELFFRKTAATDIEKHRDRLPISHFLGIIRKSFNIFADYNNLQKS